MASRSHIDPWLIALRVLFTHARIGTVVFIFSNSLQIAQVSSAQSGAVLDPLNRLLARLGLDGLTMRQIRKLAHLAEYALLGFLATLCLRVYTRRFVRHISWPLLFGLGTANADETIQTMVAGRSGQLTDVWLDFSGVCAGLFAALCLLLFLRLCGRLLRRKREEPL